MNYDGAIGWLVGEENRGLNAMFTMMNEVRLDVGAQGLALSEVAYQNAAVMRKNACRDVLSQGPNIPIKRPTRSSCIRMCGVC